MQFGYKSFNRPLFVASIRLFPTTRSANTSVGTNPTSALLSTQNVAMFRSLLTSFGIVPVSLLLWSLSCSSPEMLNNSFGIGPLSSLLKLILAPGCAPFYLLLDSIISSSPSNSSPSFLEVNFCLPFFSLRTLFQFSLGLCLASLAFEVVSISIYLFRSSTF